MKSKIRNKRSLAFFVALATLLALAIPFGGAAVAQTTADNSQDLQVFPEVDSNPTGTTHTLTAVIEGTNRSEIDFEIESGPAVRVNVTGDAGSGGTNSDDGNTPTSPDLTCTTSGVNGNNTCSVTFTSDTQGTNIIRAWVDDDQDNSTFDADATEGRNAGGGTAADGDCETIGGRDPDPGTDACVSGTVQPGARTEVDDTDVVQKTWTQAVSAACIDAEPESDNNASGTDHTITARATSSGAAPTNNDPATGGTFDCTGSALPNTAVDVAITDDDPNIFIKSINGVATGGPTAGGPNTATGTTDANGQITVVVACVSNNACVGTNSITLSVQGAQSGTQTTDTVTKTWTQAGTAQNFDATPETATNEVGQTHTITCTATDAFGTGVAGTNCDAQVTAGPNADNDIGTGGNTSFGYIGQCTTAANGSCTITYTSTETGTDTIRVFNDVNGNDTFEAGPESTPTGSPDDITKTWVAAGQGVSDVDIDMRNADFGGGETDCNDLATGADDANDDTTATNPVNTTHTVCAELFNATGGRLTGPVTFTLTGPGNFVGAGADNTIGTADDVNQGQSVTVQENGAGFNITTITSTTSGTTTVTATSGSVTATGTKTWTGGIGRNVVLTLSDTTPNVGDVLTATAKVTDRFGNPVAGVAVSFTETGVGNQQTVEATTDANGEATATYTATAPGTSTITVTITDEDPNTAGQQTTECGSAAGTPSGTTTAGNCSDTETATWTTATQQPDTFECNDGVDNDTDGNTDFPNDPDCQNPEDDSEADIGGRFNTSLTFRYDRNGDPPAFKGAVVSQRKECTQNRIVKIKRVKRGRDRVVAKDSSNRRGNYSAVKKHIRRGKYYSKTPKVQRTSASGATVVCLGDRSTIVKLRRN